MNNLLSFFIMKADDFEQEKEMRLVWDLFSIHHKNNIEFIWIVDDDDDIIVIIYILQGYLM